MSIPLPYPNPDPATGEWDPFALKRNLDFISQRIDSAISFNQNTVLFRSTGAPITTVTDTADETTVYSTSIGGDIFGTFHTIRCTIQGDMTNTAGSHAFAVRLYYGGTLFADFTSTSLGGAVGRRGWSAVVNITSTGTNTQFSRGDFNIGATGVDGSSEVATSQRVSTQNAGAVTTSTAQTLAWTVQLDAALATLDVRPFFIIGELL